MCNKLELIQNSAGMAQNEIKFGDVLDRMARKKVVLPEGDLIIEVQRNKDGTPSDPTYYVEPLEPIDR